MRGLAATVFAFSICGTAALAQGTSSVLIAPPGGAGDFCYYGGLAYSKNAILAVDTTNRREDPKATQKALIQCQQEDGADRLIWMRLNEE